MLKNLTFSTTFFGGENKGAKVGCEQAIGDCQRPESDPPDRVLETHSVAQSKQACAKPVAGKLWPLDRVIQHIDKLRLQCWIKDDNDYEVYQEGELSQILPIAELIERQEFAEGTVMLCGTISAIGGGRAAKGYHMMLLDTVEDRKMELTAGVESLPIVA